MIRFSLRRTLSLLVLGASTLSAQIIDAGLYGWFNQYSLNTGTSSIGDAACVPSASVNTLAYLQNACSSVYGANLVGTTYGDWMAAATTLIARMGTTELGTDTTKPAPALREYVSVELGFSQTTFSEMAAAGNYSDDTEHFDFTGSPTATFLHDALARNQAILASFLYTDLNGGHAITVNGLEWDAPTGTGTLYFIDPLDPSQAYEGTFGTGPARQSSGTLTLTEDGCLRLDYTQYWGCFPYGADGEYGPASAYLTSALVIGLIPEPASYALLAGLSILACGIARRRRMNKA